MSDQQINSATASAGMHEMKSFVGRKSTGGGGPEVNLSGRASVGSSQDAVPATSNSKQLRDRSQHATGKRLSKGSDNLVFPIEPTIIQVVKKPRTYTNHSYRDFSNVPAEPNDEIPIDIARMNFPQKVHHILSQPQYARFVSWRPHGRAFCITIPKLFESEVCPKYLGHTRYSSFLRQLSNHGFKHITKGEDRNCYYHEVCDDWNWYCHAIMAIRLTSHTALPSIIVYAARTSSPLQIHAQAQGRKAPHP